MAKFYIETLGCAKNTADSDGIVSVLQNAGYESSAQPADADVLIVNTCGFLQASRAESLNVMRELGERKRDGQLLIAAGCLISRYGENVKREVPLVDGVIDAGRWLAMPRFIQHLRGQNGETDDWFAQSYVNLPADRARVRSVTDVLPRHSHGPSAYLKISDGCDRPCTFCIIPAIKGGHRSKHPDDVIREARALVAQGVQELVLVAQDTTAYGWDRGQKDSLAPLLDRLANETDARWIRVMYAYPSHITPRLIETMARLPQVVNYVDVPLQHAHPETLTRMKRPNAVVTRQMLDDLRRAMPEIVIRTTFIVGFPGETEEEFSYLLDFVREQRFDRMGAFEYSREEGTSAYHLPNQVKAKVKERRRSRLMQAQQEISLAKNRAWVGRTLDVLLEGAGDGISIGRSYRDAPEVDGVVLVKGEQAPGRFVRVGISDAMEYDLAGEPTDGFKT
ncbi:MAG TPA: 30S ribosomal protein S12 methylthiotransferase RimO [Anaerolineae bacterium]